MKGVQHPATRQVSQERTAHVDPREQLTPARARGSARMSARRTRAVEGQHMPVCRLLAYTPTRPGDWRPRERRVGAPPVAVGLVVAADSQRASVGGEPAAAYAARVGRRVRPVQHVLVRPRASQRIASVSP